MPRPRLHSSDQPWPVRWLLRLYRFSASLPLAIVLLTLYTLVLIWATFVEGRYGTPAAAFGIYQSWWFAALHGLLGLNVLLSALIRLPWKKQQIGFLITHLGILVLMLGCLLTWWGGKDAQMPIFEGHSGGRAYENSQHFELVVECDRQDSPAKTAADDDAEPETIRVPFVSGPFSWYDYPRLSWFPWHLASRDEGVLYDRDGITLEVLDYYCDSAVRPLPQLTLQVSDLPEWRRWLQAVAGSAPWKAVTLSGQSPGMGHGGGRANRQAGRGDERFVFWAARGQAETDAFLNSKPRGALGPLGQVVLRAGGENHYIAVDTKVEQPRFPLGKTGLDAEVTGFVPQFLAVQLRIYRGGERLQEMILFADMPEMNRQDHAHGVFGVYWFDVTDEAAAIVAQRGGKQLLRDARQPRIDLLQGADKKLYYRTWESPRAGAAGELPADGTPLTLMREFGQPVTLFVEHFDPREKLDHKMVPLPFDSEKDERRKQPQTRVRLTVDEQAEEFWLATQPMQTDPPFDEPPEETAGRTATVAGEGRRVKIGLARDELDLGFRLFLHKFDRPVVTGTDEAAGYSSWVEMLAPDETAPAAAGDGRAVEITLNAPLNFMDPQTGRSYRFYQQSYNGPWRPGDAGFQKLATEPPRPRVYLSWLSVNFDPGRGLKYVGSLLLVVGIAIVFYMKAYFRRVLRRTTPLLLLAALPLLAAATARGDAADELDWSAWQRIPVFGQGRVMPLDTFARSVVRKICGRENPTLDLLGAAPGGDADDPRLAAARKLFPGDGSRKFTSAELLFSWLVERERWQDVPLIPAEHETLRKDVLNLPTSDEEGRRLKRVSLRQLDEAARFQERVREIEADQKRAQRDKKEWRLAGIDEQVWQLAEAEEWFAVLTFAPEAESKPQDRFFEKLAQTVETWDKLVATLETWRSLVAAAPRLEEAVDWSRSNAAISRTQEAVQSLDEVLKESSLDAQRRQFDVRAIGPRVLALRRSAAVLAERLGAQERDAGECPAGVKKRQWRDAREQLYTMARLSAELTRQGEQVQAALYDNVWPDEVRPAKPQLRRLRVAPPTRAAVADDREEENQPWLSLQAVLFGSPTLFSDDAQPQVKKVREAFQAAAAAYRNRDNPNRKQDFSFAMNRFAAALRELGETVDPDYPPPGSTDFEVGYNRANPFLWAWIVSLASLACFALAFGVLRKPMFWCGMLILIAAQLTIVAGLVLRTHISGWVSVTNMFETVVFVALCGAALGTWFTLLPMFWSGWKQAWALTAIPHTWEMPKALEPQVAAPAGGWAYGYTALVAARVILAAAVVLLLCFQNYGPGGKSPIVRLLPTVAEGAALPTMNDLLVWIVGLGILLPSVWYLPRLLVAAVLAVGAVPAAIVKQGLGPLVRDVLSRKPFAMVGAGVSFLAAYAAYYAPVFNKDIPSLAAALRDNFWLTFHVLPITASYAAGALGWGLANIALAYYLFGRYRKPAASSDAASSGESGADDDAESAAASRVLRGPEACASLGKFTYKSMQVAVLLLIAGTILGALWRDVVWGSFWSWDRKEVWSLISIMAYIVILHGRSARWFGNFGLAVGSVVGFTAIVMTWYGLNYVLPGGLHAYGRGEGGMSYVIVVTALNWLFVIASAVRYKLETRRAVDGGRS